MPGSRSRSRPMSADYWPGFVDALSTLLLVIIFLLSVFMLAQFFLSQEISGKDEALAKLNAQLADLAEQLALQKSESEKLQTTIIDLRASLSLTQTSLEEAEARATTVENQLIVIGDELESEKKLSKEAQDQAALLNRQLAALRQQLASLQAALDAAEAKDIEQQAQIADLGKRLNAALAQKVQELSRYRSEFFGKLREILTADAGFEVVGDRFVFPSSILFEVGSADLNQAGKTELRKLAAALIEISKEIPSDINWVLRVDGHTDRQKISTAQFPSNWHLSAARAISVINYLETQGVPSSRMAAAGFGEYHALDGSESTAAYQRNRRIEFKLTER